MLPLRAATDRIERHLDEGQDVYACFNNDDEGYAVRDAHRLREIVQA